MANRVVTAKANAAILEQVGQNRTPAIVIQWKLAGEGHMRRSTHWLTEASVEFTVKTLRAAGFSGSDLSQLVEAKGDVCARLLPDEVELVLQDEPGSDGKTYEQVKFVNALGGAVLQAKHGMTPGVRMEVNALFKSALAAQGGPKQQSKPDPDPNNGTETNEFDNIGTEDGDNLPF
jgi:hypothetical protein